jgi:hypothetical protein
VKVLVACECSGVVREAFRQKGHDAWSCDILPPSDGSPCHHTGPVEDILSDGWELMIAHPPCTALTVTGNRHYANTLERSDALKLVKLLLDAPIEKVCVENPVGVISSLIRKPDQYIQPFEYGHPVTKKTGLWLKNLPLLTPTKVVDVPPPVVFSSGKRMSQWFYDTSLLPHKDRAAARSVTFQGIADAMAEQWG